MTIVNLITGAFIILLGILIKHGNMHNLIAGYNTMPSDTRKNFDIVGFSTLLRDSFIMIGFIIITGNSLFNWLDWQLLRQLIIPISIGLVLPKLIIQGQKFNQNLSPEKLKRNRKIMLLVSGIITAILILFFFYGYNSIKVSFQNEEFKISGLYGIELSYDNIDKVELVSEIPQVELKENGFSLGCVMKGNFKLDKIGKCKLYLKSNKAPFIKVVYNSSRIIFFNFAESEETEHVFQELNSKIKN